MAQPDTASATPVALPDASVSTGPPEASPVKIHTFEYRTLEAQMLNMRRELETLRAAPTVTTPLDNTKDTRRRHEKRKRHRSKHKHSKSSAKPTTKAPAKPQFTNGHTRNASNQRPRPATVWQSVIDLTQTVQLHAIEQQGIFKRLCDDTARLNNDNVRILRALGLIHPGVLDPSPETTGTSVTPGEAAMALLQSDTTAALAASKLKRREARALARLQPPPMRGRPRKNAPPTKSTAVSFDTILASLKSSSSSSSSNSDSGSESDESDASASYSSSSGESRSSSSSGSESSSSSEKVRVKKRSRHK